MTIDELNALATLTAGDELPVWDVEASDEPTKKITASNLATSVKSLGSLIGTGDLDSTPTEGSNKAVTSGGTYTAIQQSTANVIRTGDVVNNLTSGGTTVPLSAEMGKTLNGKFSTVLEWVMVVNEDSTAGADFDKTVSVSMPNTAKDVMFTIQRVSNGRTIASSIVPFQQFVGGAIYAIGSYQIFGNAISSLGNFILINAVCIGLGNGQIEIACTCANINESLRFRVFYR